MRAPDYKSSYDVIIIGAGAAGMMCGAVAGKAGRRVLILDHAKTAGEKIRISGGGRCNFTNVHCGPENFISQNPHFCKSALAGYSPQDFIDQVDAQRISWHEKTRGQLFCDGRATQIVDMLVETCEQAGNTILLETKISDVQKEDAGFVLSTSRGRFRAGAVVVACGGPSIPKMGATGFGYQIAEQFGLALVPRQAALVPLIFSGLLGDSMRALAGVSVRGRVTCGRAVFDEGVLFTHRGLSGPAILQVSSYWSKGERITIDLAPGHDLLAEAKTARLESPKQSPAGFLSTFLPQRLARSIAQDVQQNRLADMNDAALEKLAARINAWTVLPEETQGYRIAEVTRGGVNTNGLSSKTMQAKAVPGLYFIGEVVDVTGHLGGHNFQWAWASGVAAGQALGAQST
ncbi:MAG: aminoacetone oxidase family FAD-binding enzyme [Robiginitomaculum sp.]|nr:MAG: aminoacetone oxidase family FAD-binding enzyme [Robiginitomaculum sp.]